jgi:hypothetical protein
MAVATRLAIVASFGCALLATLPVVAADHPWMSDAALVAAAQKEGSVTRRAGRSP